MRAIYLIFTMLGVVTISERWQEFNAQPWWAKTVMCIGIFLGASLATYQHEPQSDESK